MMNVGDTMSTSGDVQYIRGMRIRGAPRICLGTNFVPVIHK